MGMFDSFHISATALTSQRLRMDTVSANIANAQTTRGKLVDGEWQPYTRKMTVMQEAPFRQQLSAVSGGVEVSQIVEDESPYKLVYDPSHPDSDDRGYVQMPNVDLLKEMVDLMGATRSYEANIAAMNATKAMLVKAMEIGKG
ncbi:MULTISPECIES: flagellar basal body rod protein FlgC [Exiguobacterium]|jgi:flagellar basal-body rod protein FlgC|uniref:Flagellar basal-body rod protein FlgC n=1 Tax=Exiguobacterium chiriqhucha RW-2 TaxID=1345023 RepID=U1LW80_9BACL|nr:MULTISPECIES: flagellar basal body rod protein FlgC [Exiguobacterium]ERG66492.1 flagellar basal body rod protein FlgC [Exiguobacterium chiriqhucha RW-2]KAB2862612.1 MAG: flagellar basal body rod protein FlgC [Exiguobacterium chiriqhucha]MCT4776203.1 flagellar basal body rod protein FlgC [Exiguobacterium aquaticum]MCT4787979.1 flagellar basal body rod protein FlgC [Exiguobacterium mexicanum]TCI73893.1 flagellar basal body rod protein FlgC [Exiguobacterium sp. IPCI3]